MNQYPIIQPPFTLQFKEMAKTDIKKYFEWFLMQLPLRINVLESVVTHASGSNWKADVSEQSLLTLGQWFQSQVETRARTEEEIKPIQLTGGTINVDSNQLTNKTLSLAMDIGMYFAAVLLHAYPQLVRGSTLKK